MLKRQPIKHKIIRAVIYGIATMYFFIYEYPIYSALLQAPIFSTVASAMIFRSAVRYSVIIALATVLKYRKV